MISKGKSWAAFLATATLLATVSVANQVSYETSFEEAEGFTAGTFTVTDSAVQVGPDWMLSAGEAVVEPSGGAASTTQFITLRNGATIDKDFGTDFQMTPADGIIIEGYYKGAGSALDLNSAAYPADTDASAIVHFSAENGVQVLDGDKSGGGTAMDTGIALGPGQADTWMKVSVALDFINQEWSLFVDEEPVRTGLGFRDTVPTLRGFRNLAGTDSGFDDFRVVLPLKGDSNGDGVIDAADVVRLSEYALAGADSAVLFYQGDITGDGDVTNDDKQALAALIVDSAM